MSDQPVRFLHASDFQLDEPVRGLTELPDHLREVLIDSAYESAQRVFDTALAESVAFVCLAGNLLDLAHPTARSLSFLWEQLERLADASIPVFWSVEAGTAHSWPEAFPLPVTVHLFAQRAVESHTVESAGGFAARILGCGGGGEIMATEFTPPVSGQYCVALASGRADGPQLAKRNIDYWALGGQPTRKTLFTQPTIAHYSGTPQSRNPQQIGPHGCTIVEVRRPRETRLRFIPCDVVRCQHERVLVSAAAGWNDLQDILAQRVGELRSQTPTLPLLVRWTLAAADSSVDREALASLGTKSSNWLKKQFGYQSEPCWPVSVVVDAGTHIPASAYEEDTLLGDYLRAVRAVHEDRQLAVIDSPCVPDLPNDLQWLADISETEARRQVLQEATGLGAALLRGEKAI